MNAETRKALRPLVSVARNHLRNLDSDLVPHKLIPVAKSSARTLPPHLEKLLLETIENDEGLRTDLAERWGDEGRSDVTVDAFLADPAGVTSAGADLVDRAELERLGRREAELERRVRDLEAALDEAKARNADDKASHARQLRDQKAADKRARAGLESRAAAADAALQVAERQRDEARERLAVLGSKLEDAERNAERARLRASRSAAEPPSQKPSGRGAIPGDPVELAAWLDSGERMMRPFRRSALVLDESQGSQRNLAIPDGVSPDSVEAVEAILGQSPRVVLIDGYNLAGALGQDPLHSADARAAVVAVASAIRRRSGSEVVVVFDAVGVGGREGYISDAGIEVRFSTERLADDEIVLLVENDPVGAVVISNDRDVRDRASVAGAVTLWSDAAVGVSNG